MRIADMHKAYFDRDGNLGVNYPVHEQLAEHFSGQVIQVDRSIDYEALKVKVYATRVDDNYFILILNKDVGSEHTIDITLPDRLDITVHLPQRSYTSLIVDDKGILVSGIGN